MEVLTFLAVLAILIILIVNVSQINGKLQSLLKEIEKLRLSVANLEHENSTTPQETTPLTTPIEEAKKTDLEENDIYIRNIPVSETEPNNFNIESSSGYEDTVRAKMEAMQMNDPQPYIQPVQAAPVSSQSKPPTDMEKFVGENLISKIGIIILVLGIGFFVKYAIDQNWIGVYGRTAIGLITGGLMVSLAHYLRKSYKTFSSLITGGGCAVFYVTIAIAFHQYQIFSSTVAFIIMVLITIFSVLLSLAYDKKELAVFSQIGGYAAPFMVSSSNGNYVVLFTYMLVLNSGLLTLAYFKRWHILNLIAFIFTVILFSGWLATTFWENKNMPYFNAMVFATAFYVVFFLVNVLNNNKERKPFWAAEIMMILSNNLFFFGWGITILYSYQNGMFKGLFTVFAGLFNFGWVLYLYRKKQIDKKLIYLLIALVMSYISLAIPIQLNGNSITIFWTTELVILLWISQVSGIKILRTGHIILLALVIISLIIDWTNIYQYSQVKVPMVFNQAFITGIIAIAGLIVSLFLVRKEKEENFINSFISNVWYHNLLTILIFLAIFIIPFLELNFQLQQYFPYNAFHIVVLGIYVYAYLFAAMLFTKPVKKMAMKLLFGLSWFSLFMYPIVFHMNVLQIRDSYIYSGTISLGTFLFHYVVIPFIIGIIFLLNKKRTNVLPTKSFINGLYVWFVPFLIVFIASAELDNIILLISGAGPKNIYQILQVSHKVGYPILWGISAFVLITLGIKQKNKTHRVQALCLFGLIIAKLFLFDVWNMSEGGRIAAFVFLGVVLLLVSFLYQKLKNLLLDPNENITQV